MFTTTTSSTANLVTLHEQIGHLEDSLALTHWVISSRAAYTGHNRRLLWTGVLGKRRLIVLCCRAILVRFAKGGAILSSPVVVSLVRDLLWKNWFKWWCLNVILSCAARTLGSLTFRRDRMSIVLWELKLVLVLVLVLILVLVLVLVLHAATLVAFPKEKRA